MAWFSAVPKVVVVGAVAVWARGGASMPLISAMRAMTASTLIVPVDRNGGGGLEREAGGPRAARVRFRAEATAYWSSDSTDAGAWLAWASIAWPAWARIEYFVYSTISAAMSTSRIRLSAATRFSW